MSAWKRAAAMMCGLGLTVFQLCNTAGAPEWVVAPWDKLVHGLYFGALGAALWVAAGGRRPWWVVGVVAAIGLADEWHQAFLTGRTASAGDLAADVLAAAVVVLVLSACWARRMRRLRPDRVLDA